jgi:hypothetical protein
VGTTAPAETAIRATRWLSFAVTIITLLLCFGLYSILANDPRIGALLVFMMSVHPEIILWSCRVHPDAFALLFTQLSLAFLGSAADRDRPRHLVLATVFAALSAGTKLHGAFIMPIIGVQVARKHWRHPWRVSMALVPHAAIFTAIFLLTNPNLLRFPKGIIQGFLSIQTNNLGTVGSPLDWMALFVSAGGLGAAGTALALVGLTSIALHRRWDGRTAIASFALFYLSILVPSMHMVQARYAFPAMWPLLFVGLPLVIPRSIIDRGRIALAMTVFCLFVAVDWYRQGEELEKLAIYFESELSPGKRELGEKLVEIQKSRPGRVVSSPYAYVPAGIEWTYVWSLEDLEFPADASAVLVDYYLYGQPRGPNMTALLSGERGFVATATVAGFVLFEKR